MELTYLLSYFLSFRVHNHGFGFHIQGSVWLLIVIAPHKYLSQLIVVKILIITLSILSSLCISVFLSSIPSHWFFFSFITFFLLFFPTSLLLLFCFLFFFIHFYFSFSSSSLSSCLSLSYDIAISSFSSYPIPLLLFSFLFFHLPPSSSSLSFFFISSSSPSVFILISLFIPPHLEFSFSSPFFLFISLLLPHHPPPSSPPSSFFLISRLFPLPHNLRPLGERNIDMSL